jgi:hypothetical protein
MRSNLIESQSTSKFMSQIQERLSTGQQVNTALDNQTYYSAALSSKTDQVSISNEAYQRYQQNKSPAKQSLSDIHWDKNGTKTLEFQTKQALGAKALSLAPNQPTQSISFLW